MALALFQPPGLRLSLEARSIAERNGPNTTGLNNVLSMSLTSFVYSTKPTREALVQSEIHLINSYSFFASVNEGKILRIRTRTLNADTDMRCTDYSLELKTC